MTDALEPEKRGPGRPRLHPEIERPPLRPTPENKRAPLRERLRGKTRKFTTTSDRFFIPPEDIPEGVSVEWKRYSVQGQQDPFYLQNMRQQGWEPADAADFPNQAPEEGMIGSIIKDGMILMVRPMELTIQAREEVKRLSRQQVADRERANGIAPSGLAPRLAPEVDKQLMRPVPVEE